MKNVLFAIILFTCALLGGFREASAKPDCIVFGPEVSLKQLEEALPKGVESSEFLFLTELQRTLEIYYDTPDLTLLNENRFIRFQAREKLGRVKNISINHENVAIRKKAKYIREAQIVTQDGSVMTAPLRQYRNASSQVGKHPLLGMLERDSQMPAVEFLKENGIPVPLALKGMMHVSNSDLYIAVYGKEDQTLRGVINLVASYDTKTGEHIMTMCLFDDSSAVIKGMVGELGKQFSAQSGLNKQGQLISSYALLYRQMSKEDRLFDYRMRYPAVFSLGQSSIYFLFGLGIIGIFFGKRFFKDKGGVE